MKIDWDGVIYWIGFIIVAVFSAGLLFILALAMINMIKVLWP